MSRNGRGLTNGIGFTNGSGLTFGNGMVNGMGMTDGLGSGQLPTSTSRAMAVTTDKTNGKTEGTKAGLHTRVDLINGFFVEGASREARVKLKRRLSRKKRRAMRSMEKRAREPIPGLEATGSSHPPSLGREDGTGQSEGASRLSTHLAESDLVNGGESDPRARYGEVHR